MLRYCLKLLGRGNAASTRTTSETLLNPAREWDFVRDMLESLRRDNDPSLQSFAGYVGQLLRRLNRRLPWLFRPGLDPEARPAAAVASPTLNDRWFLLWSLIVFRLLRKKGLPFGDFPTDRESLEQSVAPLIDLFHEFLNEGPVDECDLVTRALQGLADTEIEAQLRRKAGQTSGTVHGLLTNRFPLVGERSTNASIVSSQECSATLSGQDTLRRTLKEN